MKEFLKKVAAQSRFEVDIYNGALKVQGRILSPQEAEALGLTSGMLALQLFPDKVRSRSAALAKAQSSNVEELDDDAWDEMIKLMSQVKPEQLLQFSEHQNRIISKCIKKGSTDQGETWNNLQLVLTEAEQDPEKDRLWVGLLTAEDRKLIVDAAMEGHKEAAERLASF